MNYHSLPDTGSNVSQPNPRHLPAVLNTCVAGEHSYGSRDLLVPHPTLGGFWKFYGRVDDQIVHSTGEKVILIPDVKFAS